MNAPAPTRKIDPAAELDRLYARRDDAEYRREAAHAHLVHELQSLPGSQRALALAAQVWTHTEAVDVAYGDAQHVLLSWVRHLGGWIGR